MNGYTDGEDNDLTVPDERPLWPGKLVVCERCGGQGLPVMSEDGWRLPIHYRPRKSFPFGLTQCAGSYAGVSAVPAAASMSDRIEEHFVRAMPPEHQEIPEAKGLGPGEGLFG